MLARAVGGMLGSLLLGAAAHAQQLSAPEPVAPAASPVPSFAELEAAGATIGEIRIDPRNIFDLSDPQEDKWLFRWANRLHIQTRPGVIERSLLFKSGEPVSARVMEETERLLRSNSYLYDVRLRPVAYRSRSSTCWAPAPRFGLHATRMWTVPAPSSAFCRTTHSAGGPRWPTTTRRTAMASGMRWR
jgi:hypothetical protein